MKKHIKFVIVTAMLLMVVRPLVTLSATGTGKLPMKDVIGAPGKPVNSEVELDGEIGDWDPDIGISKKLSDLDSAEVDGKRPEKGDYFTLSATVPIKMEYGVYKNSSYPVMGYFYSPNYKITNNGSKTINVKLKRFTTEPVAGSKYDQLYIVDVNDPDVDLSGNKPNGKVEMDLDLSYTHKGSEIRQNLAKIGNGTGQQEPVMGKLKANEEAILTFKSKAWEPVIWEGTYNPVESQHELIIELSIDKNP